MSCQSQTRIHCFCACRVCGRRGVGVCLPVLIGQRHFIHVHGANPGLGHGQQQHRHTDGTAGRESVNAVHGRRYSNINHPPLPRSFLPLPLSSDLFHSFFFILCVCPFNLNEYTFFLSFPVLCDLVVPPQNCTLCLDCCPEVKAPHSVCWLRGLSSSSPWILFDLIEGI